MATTRERPGRAAAAAREREVGPCLLLKFGELALKGRNRPRFVAVLEANLRRATADLAPVGIVRSGSTFVVWAADEATLRERCLALPGISVVQPAVRTERSAETAAALAVELLRGRQGRTFAVRPRRRDKRFPLRSIDVAQVVGAAVQRELGLDVDLSAPDLEVYVEIDRAEAYVSTERLRGAGGLPVGISGRALVLLSGGIDSPVAAYRMMKRGLRCDFVHFSGQPFTGAESAYKAYALVASLDRFQGGSRLFVVPFGYAQRRLAASGAGRLQVMAQRRLMVRVAAGIAHREGAQALVTGDSLGQVASQTLTNLAAVDDASPLPILRPLLDRDKAEIVEEARRLGSYEVSILPDEDCCTLFSAPGAAITRARTDRLRELERRAEAGDLVEELAAAAEPLEPRPDRSGAPA
jgi:tRNA uracil 4-sulfurtransferase